MEEAGKPVVVSMGGVAGSGGYYIAMGARKIVAQPSNRHGFHRRYFHEIQRERTFRSMAGNYRRPDKAGRECRYPFLP